jgi:hypothetical protein
VSEPAVRVTDLAVRHGDLEAVRGISFEVQPERPSTGVSLPAGIDSRPFGYPGLLAMPVLFRDLFSAASIIWARAMRVPPVSDSYR